MSPTSEITVNGETYILKSHVELKEKESSSKPKLNPTAGDLSLMDECNVMAIGTTTLSGDWQVVRISVQYLRRALSIMENMTGNAKGFRESAIMMCYAKDMPLCIGALHEGTGKFSGVVIAPRRDHE